MQNVQSLRFSFELQGLKLLKSPMQLNLKFNFNLFTPLSHKKVDHEILKICVPCDFINEKCLPDFLL